MGPVRVPQVGCELSPTRKNSGKNDKPSPAKPGLGTALRLFEGQNFHNAQPLGERIVRRLHCNAGNMGRIRSDIGDEVAVV